MSPILKRALLPAAFLLPSANVTGTDLIPAETFAHHPELSMVRLSPDGQHIALRADLDNGKTHALMIYALNDMAHPFMLRMPTNELPNNIVWVSNKRLIVEKARRFGAFDAPMATGEIITTDIDGKHQDYLYGYDAAKQSSRGYTRSDDQGSGFYDGQPDMPNDHFYMRTYPWQSNRSSFLYDVDSVRNTRHLIGDINLDGMSFLVGPDGTARFAYGRDDNWDFVMFRRMNGQWTPVRATQSSGSFIPWGYAPDKTRIYASYSVAGEPASLVEQDEDGGNRRILAKDGFGEIERVQWTAKPEVPFAYITSTGYPKVQYIDPNLPTAKLHMALSLKFPGEFVDFINFSQDGGLLLFKVSSDRDPGVFYLIDTRTYKVSKLFSVMPEIDPAKMASRRPIRFTASDGKELEGYLTLPPGRPESDLPMVLLPHGGPIDVRDDWFYVGEDSDNTDAQFLANRGYAVLQVNYRGSSGRGYGFKEDGYLKWGTRIQQDLIDGVKWAIDQKIADPKRICVYGGSFGGYSAMMTVIRAPGMFKCAVGFAGIYDLQMMYSKGDIKSRKSGRSYLTTVIGKNDADLAANSPDKLADKIDVPVLLVHGEEDQRAPIEQFKAMRDALDAAHKPYQTLVKPGEGHGFYDEKNTVEFYNTLQAFLEKHIGKGA
ncbi:dipeptidyl aminopeptidase/acylaminoacyl peptidase [Fulvimonas soli]|uniref:Dipeptidyl aminopeptidase/acylaminoacyl peptidase n=1 Tax=Fulvimonas soli TaxID=155197 RepID=A0A316HVK4_9GAMM|nr:dipeptidyl aminopeptidase/acylaminoacyl peptidase [Fulvimonas soli]